MCNFLPPWKERTCDSNSDIVERTACGFWGRSLEMRTLPPSSLLDHSTWGKPAAMLWGYSSSPFKKIHTGRHQGLLPTATWVNHHGKKPDQPSQTSSPQTHGATIDVLIATSWEILSLKHPAKPCLKSLKFIIRSKMFIFKLLSYGVIYYIVT